MSVGEGLSIVALLGALIGTYVGVKVDLVRTRERADHALNRANEAHRRLDTMIRR